MQFCQKHWDELKAAIKDRGLDHLVSNSGEEVCGRMKEELEQGKSTARTFDPLMGAHNAITAFALQNMGLYIMQGDICPLCELRGPPPSNWINGAADDMLAHAMAFGLVPAVQ